MSDQDNKGAHAPEGDQSKPSSQPGNVSYQQNTDDPYGYHDDPYGYNPQAGVVAETAPPAPVVPVKASPPKAPPPPPPPPPDEEDSDEDGMLRMSFLGHLEELRRRLIYMVAGLGVSFVLCLTFCDRLWVVVQEPAMKALRDLGVPNPTLVILSPMESFQIIWMKLPLLCSVFMASPWILYQVWAFIAPGLYKKERRYAAPFVICSAGLFITGGAFAYFVAFRFGLTFLLGIGRDLHVTPLISIAEYFDLFVDVVLGIGVVFELPVIIFFLTLVRVASPSFLLRHSRYAILIITILAAVITPTPDIFNMMLFAVPMVLLYFMGLFASYVLVLKRENRKFPWKAFAIVMAVTAFVVAIAVFILMNKYHYKVVPHWPFLVR